MMSTNDKVEKENEMLLLPANIISLHSPDLDIKQDPASIKICIRHSHGTD